MLTKNVKTEKRIEIPQTPFAYFLYVNKPFKWWAIASIVFVVLASSLGQLSSFFFKLIIDSIESGDFNTALTYALFYPLALFLIQLLYRGSGVTGIKWIVLTEKFGYDLLTRHVMKHSHSFFIDRFAGSILSKISNVTMAVDRITSEILWTLLISLVQLLVTIGILLSIDTKAALVFIALVLFLGLFNYWHSVKQGVYARIAAQANTDLRARLVDTIGNIQAVRQYARAKFEEDEVYNFSDRVREAGYKRFIHFEWMFFWNGLILAIFSTGVFWFLITGWKDGLVTTGDLVLILALYLNIGHTLTFIGRAFSSAARSVGEMREGLEDLLVPIEIVDSHDAKDLSVNNATIDWENVSFDFEGNHVFSNFNLQIPAGQRLGLVGQSGAGKTTFVSLLLRQHELEDGSVTIDGQDISEVTQDSLRQAIAVVPQEPALFHRTIRENILYGNSEATEEEMIEVAKKAQAHDFIVELPRGYETMVGERGVKLSGGQKQRVAIARAMLKDAPILVLDEATSALDSESEVAIQKALEILMEGRTVIAIAHRLSTLRKMDRIIVMENGLIIEDGNHQLLAQAGGTYERLWNHQAGGFVPDSDD